MSYSFLQSQFSYIAVSVIQITLSTPLSDELAVSFNPKQIIPENNTLSKDTCTRFVADNNSSKEQFSTFRIELAEDNVFFVNVSLQGLNMSGGNDLYVTPLTESQTRNWSGMWMTCHLARKSDGDGIKRYTFSCPCYGICKAIQVIRRPHNFEESHWDLCHVCLSYNTTGNLFKILTL